MARALHWFRNDLRLRDNTALTLACAAADELLPVFVLDPGLLERPETGAARVRFLLDALARLAARLAERGSRLLVLRGPPERELAKLLDELRPELLSFNRDPAPYARRRDEAVRTLAEKRGVRVQAPRDRTVFEACDVLTKGGEPFRVYTPFMRAWYERARREPPRPQRAPRLPPAPSGPAGTALPSAAELGFPGGPGELPTAGEEAARRRLRSFLERGLAGYGRLRDLPAEDGTSRLSPHLRFGTVSVRECLHEAREAALAEPRLRAGARRWMDELVWREFYAAQLERHPELRRRALRPELDGIAWRNDPDELAAWREGRTGFPLVDAGIRQLLATGWMHNRTRMVVASFLVKDLLVDWRVGERFFLEHLVDGDPASNAGGWQWAASTGTDSQPYFRIFHPLKQGRRFDPEGRYLRRWLPELARLEGDAAHEPGRAPLLAPDYPAPIVDHAERREQALLRYRTALARARPEEERR